MEQEILPGLTVQGAALILQLAQNGLVTLQNEFQVAGTALNKAIQDKTPKPPEPSADSTTTV